MLSGPMSAWHPRMPQTTKLTTPSRYAACFSLTDAWRAHSRPRTRSWPLGSFDSKCVSNRSKRPFCLGVLENVAMLNGRISGPITSLAYFQAVVDEVRKLQMSADYIKYLRQRVTRLEEQWLDQNPARVHHQA